MFRTTTTTRRLVVTFVMLPLAATSHEYTYAAGAGAPHAPVVYEQWHNGWLGGLISPDQEIALREMCPYGNATTHEEGRSSTDS